MVVELTLGDGKSGVNWAA